MNKALRRSTPRILSYYPIRKDDDAVVSTPTGSSSRGPPSRLSPTDYSQRCSAHSDWRFAPYRVKLVLVNSPIRSDVAVGDITHIRIHYKPRGGESPETITAALGGVPAKTEAITLKKSY